MLQTPIHFDTAACHAFPERRLLLMKASPLPNMYQERCFRTRWPLCVLLMVEQMPFCLCCNAFLQCEPLLLVVLVSPVPRDVAIFLAQWLKC